MRIERAIDKRVGMRKSDAGGIAQKPGEKQNENGERRVREWRTAAI